MEPELHSKSMTDIHTYIHIHTAAYPWPTIRDPLPRTNALGNKFLAHTAQELNYLGVNSNGSNYTDPQNFGRIDVYLCVGTNPGYYIP